MKIEEYRNICEKVQVSDVVLAGYESAIEQIKEEGGKDARKKEATKRKQWKALPKAAVIFGVAAILSGSMVCSVRAYISHMQNIRNMDKETIIDLYENVYQHDSKYMSRAMSESEESRFGELYDLYCRDMAEPEGEAAIIASKEEYEGEGIAFAKADGILYLPEREMTEEEILQLVVFHLLEQYVDYEAYVKADNPLYYLNAFDAMTMQEVDTFYVNYRAANTETGFYSRALSFEELGQRKALKILYKNGEKHPEHTMPVIEEEGAYTGEEIAFCKSNCTIYFPEGALTEEQLLELIDFEMKADYCRQRIAEEVSVGIRSDWPHIDYVERERTLTLDPDMVVEDGLLSQPWLKAYAEILKDYYSENSIYYENPERYYANVCFIYLNEDAIPEMLFSHGCTDLDYNDNCNLRNYLYTYRDGAAVLLTPGEETMDAFYGYQKPFRYVEGKGMVYCDYYYIYGFSTYHSETDVIDQVTDSMSRMDVWNLDTLTCTSSASNMEMVHAVYNYTEEEYADADFSVAYYVNVSDIVRDEQTGYVKEIKGEKVDRQAYERSEAELWQGEQFTTLAAKDYDKIYSDDNPEEALAKSYMKHRP